MLSLPLASVDSRLTSILKMDASSSSSQASAGRGKPASPSCRNPVYRIAAATWSGGSF